MMEILSRVEFTVVPDTGRECLGGKFIPEFRGPEYSCLITAWDIQGKFKINYYDGVYTTHLHEAIFTGSWLGAMIEAQEWLRAHHLAQKGAVA